MFECFTETARSAIIRARALARGAKHHGVAEQHLLRALIHFDDVSTISALRRIGVDIATLCIELDRWIGRTSTQSHANDTTPLTETLCDVLTKAAALANQLFGVGFVAPECLMVSLLRYGQPETRKIMYERGVTEATFLLALRSTAKRIVASYSVTCKPTYLTADFCKVYESSVNVRFPANTPVDHDVVMSYLPPLREGYARQQATYVVNVFYPEVTVEVVDVESSLPPTSFTTSDQPSASSGSVAELPASPEPPRSINFREFL